MSLLRDQFYQIVQYIGENIGPGHSEVVYQKGCSQILQSHRISHHTEHHVPIVLQIPEIDSSSITLTPNTFHIGDERIDILMYDDNQQVHIVELKAVAAKLSPINASSCSVLSAPHVQLLKYIRMLRKDEKYAGRIHTGYLVNFRQHVTHDTPDVMTVEFDIYDAATDTWTFNYTPDVA